MPATLRSLARYAAFTDEDLSAGEVLVAYAIAHSVDADGWSSAGQLGLCRLTRQRERTVRAQLRSLAQRGLVDVEPSPTDRRCRRYRLKAVRRRP